MIVFAGHALASLTVPAGPAPTGPVPTGVPVPADFSNDNGWVMVAKMLFVFVFLVINVLMAIILERKIIGRMQNRYGPNRTGPKGLLQSLADGVKLALKEDVTPTNADRTIYWLAPALSAVPCFLSFAVIPLAGPVAIWRSDGETLYTPLQMTDFPVAVLYILAIASIGVYGLVLAGWSSGSTYPLLGGIRSSAQVISYELGMGLALVSVFIMAGSMSTSQIVAAQHGTLNWILWFVPLSVPFVIYVISMVGETNRLPFDLPEAEGELVGGFHTEYSSLKFALFFLAEYVNMVTVSALAATLFLGGWQAPFGDLVPWLNAGLGGWIGLLWFTIKVWLFMFLFIWLRGSLPRYRYDQFMKFGWQRLIPVALAWIFLLALIRYASVVRGLVLPRWFAIAAGVVLVIAALLVMRAPSKPEETEPEVPEFEPMAGGHPVPPLPGQVVPPSPRRARQVTGTASLTKQSPAEVTTEVTDD